MTNKEQKELVERIVNQIRPISAKVWERALEIFKAREQKDRYVCTSVAEAISEFVDGLDMRSSTYFTLENGKRVHQRLVFSVCFPEFQDRYNNGIPYTYKDLGRCGWFGRPNDRNDQRRIEAMEAMIRLYKVFDKL